MARYDIIIKEDVLCEHRKELFFEGFGGEVFNGCLLYRERDVYENSECNSFASCPSNYCWKNDELIGIIENTLRQDNSI